MSDISIESLEEQLAAAADDRERVRLLNELSHLARFRDLDHAMALAEEALGLAERVGERELILRSILQVGDCRRFRSEYETARRDFERAGEMVAGMPENRGLKARYHTGLGNLMLVTNRCREAVGEFGCALEIYTEDDNRAEMARLLCYQGQAEGRLRNDLAAMELFKRGLEIATGIGDMDLIGVASYCLGMVYSELGNGERALHYLSRALEYRSSTGGAAQLASLHDAIANAHSFLGDLDSAIEHGQKSLAIYRQAKVPRGIGAALANLAETYEDRHEYDLAMEYACEAVALAEAAGETFLIDSLTIQIGRLHWKNGDPVQALPYLEQVLSRQHDESYWNSIWSAYWTLTNVHEELGNAAEALKYYKLWAEMREEMQGKAKAEAVAEAERKMLLTLHEQEREIYRLKNEQLERELARDRRELASLATHLSQKNAAMVSLEEKIRELEIASGSSAAPMSSQVRRAWGESQDWEEFSERFTAVYPEFMRNLASRYPDLTPMERKVSALMRMDLATKEIANILYTSVRTVEGHRRFIRRKLGLGRDANLSTFLASLG